MIELRPDIDKSPADISASSPCTAAQHDEWLLDEALAETFPASDSIAVSSKPPGRDSSAGKA